MAFDGLGHVFKCFKIFFLGETVKRISISKPKRMPPKTSRLEILHLIMVKG